MSGKGHVDPAVVADLARAIAEADAKEFGRQYPAYAADIGRRGPQGAPTPCTAISGMAAVTMTFVVVMVYGERPEFDEAFATVAGMAEDAWRS